MNIKEKIIGTSLYLQIFLAIFKSVHMIMREAVCFKKQTNINFIWIWNLRIFHIAIELW